MATYRSGHATYYLDVTLVSQNQAGNYSTVNVHLYAIADSGWSGFASGIGFSVSSYGNGSFSFNGSSIEILNQTFNVGHDANGYGSVSVSSHTNATGTSTFAGPTDMVQGLTLPRIPKVPSVPQAITATAQPGLKAQVSIAGSADNGGSAITAYYVQYSKDGGAWTGQQNISSGSYTYTGLLPGSYKFRTWAVNGIGSSGFRESNTVQVLPGGYVWNGTAWVASLGVYTWDGSNWVISTGVYVWNGTSWAISL